MADRLTIARPYAKAAFAAAKAASRLGPDSLAIARGAAAVADERVKHLLGSPRVTAAQLADFIGEIAGNDLSDGNRNFFRLLADNKRLGFLPEISRVFDQLKDEAEGVVDVTVTSAAPMGEGEQGTLAASLEKRFGRTVRVHAEVDPELLGGATVRAGDLVIDGSLKSRLERLALELTA
ncbi:MAG: synthase subunit delta [Pseudomonadota bacterium]|jgi:F-type H+-transporting ATPase subunit delta